jgi:hypothetical protein
MRLRALAFLGGLILLLLPAAALAQSAGDEQYSDPFADKSPTAKAPSSSPAPDSSQPAQSTGQLAQTSSPGSDDNDSSSSGALPRTGTRAWTLALMGSLMLLGGALLRLGARPLRLRVGGITPPTLGRDIRLTRRRR